MSLIGSHGAEIRHRGAVLANQTRPATLDKAAAAFSDAFAGCPGVIIEGKSLGVTVHYRQNPASGKTARDRVSAFAHEHGLEVQEGKMMVELRLPGHDKGSALAVLLREPPFADHPPFFAGDDLTDEPGFAICSAHAGVEAVNALTFQPDHSVGADQSRVAERRKIRFHSMKRG